MKVLPVTLGAFEKKEKKIITTTGEEIDASFRGGYIVPPFEVEATLEDEDLAFKLVSFILRKDDSEKDLAETCAIEVSERLADYFGLAPKKANYLSDGVREDITLYLKSQVFNLRTVERIKTPLTQATAKIIHWFNSLPDTNQPG